MLFRPHTMSKYLSHRNSFRRRQKMDELEPIHRRSVRTTTDEIFTRGLQRRRRRHEPASDPNALIWRKFHGRITTRAPAGERPRIEPRGRPEKIRRSHQNLRLLTHNRRRGTPALDHHTISTSRPYQLHVPQLLPYHAFGAPQLDLLPRILPRLPPQTLAAPLQPRTSRGQVEMLRQHTTYSHSSLSNQTCHSTSASYRRGNIVYL